MTCKVDLRDVEGGGFYLYIEKHIWGYNALYVICRKKQKTLINWYVIEEKNPGNLSSFKDYFNDKDRKRVYFSFISGGVSKLKKVIKLEQAIKKEGYPIKEVPWLEAEYITEEAIIEYSRSLQTLYDSILSMKKAQSGVMSSCFEEKSHELDEVA